MNNGLNNSMEEKIFDLMMNNICPACSDYESRCDHVGSCTEQCLNNHGVELSSSAVERLEKQKLRDQLLINAGVIAAELYDLGMLTLPRGIDGNDELSAGFVASVCDKYINEEIDIPFDKYIEKALMDEYGGKEQSKEV